MSASPLRAVIYARYSSSGQQDQSIDGQMRVCKEYAKRENIMIVGEYIDRAIPGKTDARPDFQRMISDSKKKQFNYVLVYKLDRFARNRYDSAIYKHKLKLNDVKLLSAMENIGDNPESIILEAVLEASAEYYSLELSQKVKRGMRESAIKGKSTGANILLGYKSVDKKIVIDEDKAPIIKYVFAEYAKGKSKKEIVDEINSKGWLNNKGKPFTANSFHNALRNKKYIGINVYGGITYEDVYPPIIDVDTFNKVQAKLDEKKRAPAASKAHQEYLLRGKAFCGMCGARMVGESGKGRRGTKYYYYACADKKKKRTCKKKNEKKDFLEWYVVEQTLLYVLTPDRMKYIAKRVVAEYDNEFNVQNERNLEKRIKQLDREMDKAVDIMLKSDSDAIIKRLENNVKTLELQKADLEIDLSKLKIANGIRYTEKDIIAWLKVFCKGDPMDKDFRSRIIDTFINSIYVYDNKVVTWYNIKDCKQVSLIETEEALDGENLEDILQGESVRISDALVRQKE